MSVLPSVWTMEIDMFHERSKERDLQMADVSGINSSLPNTDSEKVYEVRDSHITNDITCMYLRISAILSASKHVVKVRL